MHMSGQTQRVAASSFVALALAIVPMAMPSTASAKTVITVTTRADTLARDGRCSLREAIRAANLNRAVSGCPAGSGADTIVLPAGRYVLTIPGRYEDAALTGDLDIRSNLTIRGVSAAKTIIDGNELDRVFDISWGKVQLDRLTVTGGQSLVPDGPYLVNDGGGIANRGSLLVTASSIAGNTAVVGYQEGGNGGGIFSSGTLTVRDSTISGNSARGGGGISASADTFLIRDRVIGNSANDGYGPGRYGPGHAAGIDSSSYLVLSSSLVAGNHGTTDEWTHGGIAMTRGVISDSTIRDNAGSICGSGGVVMVGGQMLRTTVSNNSTDNCGPSAGGVFAIDSEIVNSTISGNHGSQQASVAGIYSDGSSIVNSTITGNFDGTVEQDKVHYDGPGGLLAEGSAQTTISNTIVAGNLGGSGYPDYLLQPDCEGTIVSGGHNLIGDLAGCTFQKGASDLIGVNPLLGPLAANGGPTLTHMLRVGSPAIDAWYDIAVGPGATCPALDQRGVHRPQDGNHDGRAGCDIGAVERMP